MLDDNHRNISRCDPTIPDIIRVNFNRGTRATLSQTTRAIDRHPGGECRLLKGFENGWGAVALTRLMLANRNIPIQRVWGIGGCHSLYREINLYNTDSNCLSLWFPGRVQIYRSLTPLLKHRLLCGYLRKSPLQSLKFRSDLSGLQLGIGGKNRLGWV